jgi:hypothetical protein
MKKFHWNKPALVIGLFAAAMHVLWVLSVAIGVGQSYLDWIFPLHLISNPYSVMPFNLGSALLLPVVAFVCSYIATLLFVWLWKIVKVKNK